jgi:hypothetical protein
MGKEWIIPKMRYLFVLLLIALVYTALINSNLNLTGNFKIDGTLGIIFGLFVCAHPAANVLDFVLYGKYLRLHSLSPGLTFTWWLTNGVVMYSGLLVFVVSLLRYTDVIG